MRFSVHSVILALAVHTAITSARAVPTAPGKCKESNKLDCVTLGSFAVDYSPLALRTRGSVAPSVKGGGSKDEPSSSDPTSPKPAGDDPDSSPPITGDPVPEDPSSVGDEPTEPITGKPSTDEPAPAADEPTPAPDEPPATDSDPVTSQPDANQAIGLQKPVHAENIGQYRSIINWLKNPADANSKTPRLEKDETLFWSSADDEAMANAIEYSEVHNLKTFQFLSDSPNNPTAGLNVDTAVEDEWTDIASAALARASSGEVKVMLDPSGMKADTKFVKFEWPELMANNEVSAIRSINTEKNDDTKIIWTRDQGTKAPVDTPLAQLSGSHQ